jgi:hypothetical protein
MNQILIRARELIADPEHWLQGDYAEDNLGIGVLPWDPDAYRRCLLGAVDAAAVEILGLNPIAYSDHALYCVEKQPEVAKVIHQLQLEAPAGMVADFNDDPETTHADVLALIDRVLAL